jgi:putative transposase
MQKGIKFRAYPNKEQQNLINRTLGCCRLIYNKGLAMRNDAYRKGSKAGYSQTSAMLTELKKDPHFTFLKEVDSIALQQSLRDLDRGFVNFFKKRAAHPTFKSRHNHRQSYRTVNQGNNIRIVGKYIKLPKLGYVKIKQSMEVGKINNVTIERTPAGKYFVVLNVEFEPQPMSNKGGTIGIGVGIKKFYSDSNGNAVHNPKYLEKSMRKLIREQRRLSRKQKGSNNRNKQRVKVALVHEKVTNQRNDFLQKQSTMLVRENQTICIEDLAIKEMMRTHKLARHIADASWSNFYRMLEYKAEWYGGDVIKVPGKFPDSHSFHDRDINDAINILQKGLATV